MKAEIITIGDEILIGQIVDTNSAWIAQSLNKIGIIVKQITSISDETDHIKNALKEAEQRADIILITGGLGPTKDDVTKQTLAEYFGTSLVLNEEALGNVKRIFQRYNRPLLDVNIKQAEVPANCNVIQNLQGTAPGMHFVEKGKHYFSMPGVPFEMKAMMETSVLPILNKNFIGNTVIHETILTANLGESFLAKQIEDIENDLPENIKLAYLPKLGQVRLRLSGISSQNNKEIRKELLGFKNRIVERIHSHVIATEDISIEEAVLRKLMKGHHTISTAESCTGGYIGHLFTSVPGSSASYLGGAVSYSYEMKESMLGVSMDTIQKHGAVSKETVEEMAKGAVAKYGSTYSIACSGIAGPGGGSAEKPVGTVWIAIADKNKVFSKHFVFGNQRMQNIERTAIQALYMLYRFIGEDIIE